MAAAFRGHQAAVFYIHAAASARQVGGQNWMVFVCPKKSHSRGGVRGHSRHHGIHCVKHRHALRRNVLHDHPFYQRQFFNGVDEVQPQMVATAHIGHHRHIAAVKSQAFAQHAAACSFQNRSVYIGMLQHAASALRAAAVSRVDAFALHIHPVGAGHAHAPAMLLKQVRNQPYGGGFAVGTRYCHHRNAAVFFAAKHGLDDGFAHRAPFAKRRRQMHAQTGCCIHFHHTTALGFKGLQDAFAHHVYPANVQSHHFGCRYGARSNRGVHVVGHVGGSAAGGQVGVVPQVHPLALDGY